MTVITRTEKYLSDNSPSWEPYGDGTDEVTITLDEEARHIRFAQMEGKLERSSEYLRRSERPDDYERWGEWIIREAEGIREFTAVVRQNGRIVVPKKVLETLSIQQGDTVLATMKLLLKG